jgi:ribosome-binding factor A
MSQDKRLLRLAEQFKREIYEILRRDVQDPRVGSPTITSVRVTPDLWLARVFVRLPGDEEAQARALEGLTAAAPFVRKRLGRTLRLRRVPEVRFVADDTLDGAMRIEEILREVGPLETPGDGAEGGEEAGSGSDSAVSDGEHDRFGDGHDQD